MAGIFNNLFNANIFNGAEPADGPTPPPVIDVKTGTGGIDGDAKRRRIYKPTGLTEPRKARLEERIDDSREIQAEIAGRLAKEFAEELEEVEIQESPPIEEMTPEEIAYEIGVLLRKKLKQQQQEEEEMFAMMLAVAIADER